MMMFLSLYFWCRQGFWICHVFQNSTCCTVSALLCSTASDVVQMENATGVVEPDLHVNVIAARKSTNEWMSRLFTTSEMATCVLSGKSHNKRRLDQARVATVFGM